MTRASSLESEFAMSLKGAGLACDPEYAFAEKIGRKFRADFRTWNPAIVDEFGMVKFDAPHSQRSGACAKQVLVEIHGTGPQGRHGSYGRHHLDCEKASIAAALGWRVLPLSAKMVRDGSGLALVEAALGLKPIPVKDPKERRKSLVPRSSRKTGKELPERVRKAAGLA